MKRNLFYLLIIVFTFSGCSLPNGSGSIYNTARSTKKLAPSGKFRNPTLFSRINPFQGRAKAKLSENKRKKSKFFKKKHKQSGSFRKNPKPGRNFGLKRTVSKKRLRSSGSRSKSRGGGRKRNKNLFNTRKK